MFFSIIIPVYNVEPYLQRCVDSALGQDYPDKFEIILVDDGSTDKSGSICDDYAQKDARIRVVHKENGGLSSARNAGVKIATGEYIVFLDSDDWIDDDALARLDGVLTKNAVDVCAFLYKVADASGVRLCERVKKCPKKIVLTMEDFLGASNLGPEAWIQVYRSEFLFRNDIRFPEGLFCEDVLFTTRISLCAADIVVLDYCGYNYFQREDSIMHTEQPEKVRKA
jgi:glycosyltransferase involved in cell wall biosynthesis